MADNVSQVRVHSVADAQFHDIARLIRMVACDIDGTLARSKKPMHDTTIAVFSSLTHVIPVAIVTGGRFELIESQILDVAQQYCYMPHLDLLPTAGATFYTWDDFTWRKVYDHNFSDEQRDHVYRVVEQSARAHGVWYSNAQGARIEDRGSQITFSALGQNADLNRKEVWDPCGIVRQPIVDDIAAALPGLSVRLGGLTSIDITHAGIDKAFAVRALAAHHQVAVDSIAFLGDRMTPEGNDYPAAAAGTYAINVDSIDDTEQALRQFIEAYTHGLYCDVVRRELWVKGEQVDISETEFSLLLALMHSGGQATSRADLIKEAWGYGDSGDTRMLSVSISRLRQIIEDDLAMPRHIVTVRGGGYRLNVG